jgi:transcriptional regulator GlxA family with amidase domain
VQDAVVRDPTANWTAQRLANVACTSTRNLARLFADHAHCSPLDYVQLIRFAFAKELVTQSKLDLERIAAKAGFRSAQHLRRVWARWESLPPSAFRPREHQAGLA